MVKRYLGGLGGSSLILLVGTCVRKQGVDDGSVFAYETVRNNTVLARRITLPFPSATSSSVFFGPLLVASLIPSIFSL